MTPLPKRRWSTHRQGRKRSTIKAAAIAKGKCPNCGFLKAGHSACPACGFYKGKKVINIREKKIKGQKQVENKQ